MFPARATMVLVPLSGQQARYPEICMRSPTMMQRMHTDEDTAMECAREQLLGNPGQMRFHPGNHMDPRVMVLSPGQQFRAMYDWTTVPEIRERMEARKRYYRV